MHLRRFIEEVASRSSAPGGGSASAQIAALGVGLGAMVAKLTYGVRKFEAVDGHMRTIIPPLHRITQALIPLIDADADAFNDYVQAMRLPGETAEEKLIRHNAMQAGLKSAIRIPLTVMRLGDDAWEGLRKVAEFGNPASKSDVQVGARALEMGIWGAWQNVLINMTDIEDKAYKAETLEEAEQIAQRASKNCQSVLDILAQRQ